MNDTIAKHVAQAPDDQRKAARTFHRACVGEGHKNLRQAAGMYLPMAALADFPLAIGLAVEMATKLTSPRELERLRELGRAKLSAMEIEPIEEERVQIEVLLDAMPRPGDVKRLVALGLKRVRKDLGGRRFTGLAAQAQVSALVAQLGGTFTALEKERGPVESGSDDKLDVAQMVDAPAAKTIFAISEAPAVEIDSERPSGLGSTATPSTEDAASTSSPVPAPIPRPAPRFPVSPRPDLPDQRRSSISATLLRGQERSLQFADGFPDDPTKPTVSE